MTAPAPPKLELIGVAKRYRTGKSEFTAVTDVDLSVDTGEFVALLGASGCGKSTLLNIVGGLEHPTEGHVEIDGETVVGPGPDRGMVFQGYSLFPWKTAAENVAFGLECGGMPRATRRERVDEVLEIMGLSSWSDRLPKELSGGMRQRVAIARALASEPDVLLLDEPFGALDAQTRGGLHTFLLDVWRRLGTTIVIVTHDVEEAVLLAGRVVILESGPGRVGEEVRVSFDRRRDEALKLTPEFLEVRARVQSRLATHAQA